MRVTMSVVLGVGMRMAVAMAVAVTVTMVMVAEGHHTDEVNGEAKGANNEEFAESLRFGAFPESLEGLKGNLQTQKPMGCMSVASCAAGVRRRLT